MGNTKRYGELDYVRVISMLAVIIVHVTSTYIYVDSKFTLAGMNIAFILNQITRFSVPLFILLSGISLNLSSKKVTYFQFIKHRVIKIFLPYFFWCLVYFIMNWQNGSTPPCNINVVWYFLRSVILGSLASHLYFITVIFQLYLIYPILKRIMDKHPIPLLIIAFFISFFINQIMYLINFGVNLVPKFVYPYLWELLPTWIFYFVLGMYISKPKLDIIFKISGDNIFILLPFTIIFGILFSLESKLTGSLDSIKPQLFLYVILVFISCLGAARKISNFKLIDRLISFIANHSLTIFLSHVLILNYLRRFPYFLHGMKGMLLMLLIEIIISIIFACFFDSIVTYVKLVISKIRFKK